MQIKYGHFDAHCKASAHLFWLTLVSLRVIRSQRLKMDFDIEFQEVCCPAIILFVLCLPRGVVYNITEQKQHIKFGGKFFFGLPVFGFILLLTFTTGVELIKCGIPQGSISGPIIFTQYPLPLGQTIHHCMTSLESSVSQT